MDTITRLNIKQLDLLGVLMHSLNHLCIDWTIDCDDIEIVVSEDQMITLKVKDFGLPADCHAKDIYAHILNQLNSFTKKV